MTDIATEPPSDAPRQSGGTTSDILTVDGVLQSILSGAAVDESIDTAKRLGWADSGPIATLIGDLPAVGSTQDATALASTSFSDPVATRDTLGISPYVEAFARLLLHLETTTPLVIGVLGEWGKGKSSFMRLLRSALETHDRDRGATGPIASRAVTVWFDAWQYNSEERVLAALLQAVATGIEEHFTPYSWFKYRLLLQWRALRSNWRLKYRLIGYFLVTPTMFALLAVALWKLGPSIVNKDSGISVERAIALFAAHWGIGFILVAAIWTFRSVRRLKLPLGLDLNALYDERDHVDRVGYLGSFTEEFRRRMGQLAIMPTESLRKVTQAEGLTDAPVHQSLTDFVRDLHRMGQWWLRPWNEVFKKQSPGRETNRVVVFIDDLDRCRPETLVEVLEAIKVTLDTPGLAFVLGMDDRYIKSGIYLKYASHIAAQDTLYGPQKSASPPDGAKTEDAPAVSRDHWPDQYLEKIIQIGFRLPDADASHIRSMVAPLLSINPSIPPSTGAAQDGAPNAAEAGPVTPNRAPEQTAMSRVVERRFRDALLQQVESADVDADLLDATVKLTPVYQGNPRRVKAFVNRCRLGLYLLKLQFPELLPSDMKNVISMFADYEQATAAVVPNGSGTSDDPYAYEAWYPMARQVRHCLFET
jgi:hypothetical protein